MNRYNKKHAILCNFLSYESLKCFALPFVSLALKLRDSVGLTSGSPAVARYFKLTKTLFPLIFVSFQRALSWHALLYRKRWRFYCLYYCRLLQ